MTMERVSGGALTFVRNESLSVRIRNAVRRNQSEAGFLLKNPITDFLSFHERSRIAEFETRKALTELAKGKMSPGERRMRIAELAIRPKLCLKVMDGLKGHVKGGDEAYATAMLDVLERMKGPKVYKTVKWLADNGPKDSRERAEEL